MAKIHKFRTMLSAVTATGYSGAFDVSDYKNVSIAIAGADTSVLTVKVLGSIQESAPTFSSAQAVANVWDYVDVLDLEDGASIDGDTGVALSANDVRQFEVNTENLQWLGVQVSAYTSGNVTVTLSATNED